MDVNRLFCVIPVGKEKAIKQNELAEKLGCTPTQAKRLVKKAREQGMFILSGQCGYWLPRTKEEIDTFYNSLRKQGLSRLSTASHIKPSESTTGKKQISGQTTLKDYL